MNDPKARAKRAPRPDLATIGGLLLALTGIVGGLLLEGGKLGDIGQFTAAIIVLGGTFGAVMVSTPLPVLKGALGRLVHVFLEDAQSPGAAIDEIITYATKARKNGLVSLEHEASVVADPFLRKALNLAVDGTELQQLRAMLELDIQVQEHNAEVEAMVFESAGGYAPTIGIIGAVMGLIQVMKNLANIEGVGHGIAIAFVATVYGVALANIVLLPVANKIKVRAHQQTQARELILEGVMGIAEGLNPTLIRSKLGAYTHGTEARTKTEARTTQSAPGATAAESV